MGRDDERSGKMGGAEAVARFKQYDYKANSTLVLTADKSTRILDEPTGEPETLWGKMKPKSFGDRVKFDKPSAADGLKKRQKQSTEEERPKKKRAQTDVLSLETEGLYRPKTRETRAAYETLLSQIQAQFGDQPQDILRGAADEVLAVLKDDKKMDPERKREIEKLLGGISSEHFATLVNIGKHITDFVSVAEGENTAADAALDDGGVAVEFEDEEDDEYGGGQVDEVMEDEEDDGPDEEEGERAGGLTAMAEGADGGDGPRDDGIKVSEIDAYWLQREVSRACGFTASDAETGRQLSEKVLSVLEDGDDRQVENKLVALLDVDKFDLIKLLVKNRLRVLWCTRLARAQDEPESRRIEATMAGDPRLASTLAQLHQQRMGARERQQAVESKIREEARKLRAGEAAAAPSAAAGGGADKGAASGRKVLELDMLAFAQGRHLMSNKKCELPPGSYRSAKKGYEEVHVPALKPKAFAEGEKLVPIDEMPEWARPAFEGMKSLNRVQSRVFPCAFFEPENLLLCAPTGAGKTNVAMLTILHEVGMHLREDGSVDLGAFKIVYVAPMKALVAEMVGNLGNRLKPFGIQVRELTGDINMSKAEIEQTQVIVTTPEKWDIITRKSGDRTYTQLVRLLIIDEIHLLHDDRGPVLESIVARTLRQVEATQELVRIVGLSATLPNYEDVAVFMRVNPEKGLFVFDNSFRPCPLQQQYIGVNVKKALQRFQLMNEIAYEKVLESAGKHQVLVFVHSRKETAKTARFFRDTALAGDQLNNFLKENSASREVLQSEAEGVKNAHLKDVLPYGFAIHHAGMTRADRTLVEDLFADGHIQVLVSTATLAWGVNLPAHTVIIKGTQVYSPEKNGWEELSPMDVMQMMGRAGRPQYDTFGEGIIITTTTELQFYLSLFNQQLPVESQFISKLADNLNAECVLGTVTSIKDATTWLGYSYLFVRMLRNPNLYGVGVDAVEEDPRLEGRRADLAHTAAIQLDKAGLVKYDRRSGALQVTDLGKIASHYYITHGTVAAFNEHLKPNMTEIELCRLFSLAEEFKYIGVREEEKLEVARLLERVPIPVKESLEEPSAKINVLLQAHISGLKLEGFALMADMVYVTQSAGRLLRALFEIALKRGWAMLAEKALNLCKCCQRRMWGSQTPLRQFKGVPIEIITKIENRLAWENYYDLSSQEIGELLQLPKMGKTVHKLVHQFPRLELSASVQPITRSIVKIDLTLSTDFQWDDKVHGFVEPWWILVEDGDQEIILHSEYFLLKQQYRDQDATVSFTVPLQDPLPPQYFIRVISDKWLGAESTLPVSFRELLLPEKYPPPTELLDLAPLPVSALRNARVEALYSKRFKVFNPIQTQVFTCLYNTDDSALVCAPTGSGKTVIAEFAVLRFLSKVDEDGNLPGKAVYVAPLEAAAHEVYLAWRKSFGEALGVEVVELTGDGTADLKLLERGQLVVATAERWDMVSRRFKQRKAVQATALFIADELHLIGGEHGPVLEVGVSRVRQIAALYEKPIRIVGLSTSLANAQDVGDWIGARGHSLFNFHPTVRPVPLEVHIHGVDIINFDSRMQAMARPVYTAVATHADDQPAIVYVPTRKHAKLAALDLLTFASAEGAPMRFLHAEPDDLAPFLGAVRDTAVKHALSYGVGLLHEGLSDAERGAVEALFESGALQVLVCTAGMCWSLTAQAKLVVVMGTQYFDAALASGTADYPLTDLLQMLGRASRPGVDDKGVAVLLCHAPRKEYYKRFLNEPFPVESHLDSVLADHLCAEVVTLGVKSPQDAVDYLTWTFYYRRLVQNPNYYNLRGTSHRHLSDHLSELAESTLKDLEQAKCISIENDEEVSPLNLGMISSYYYTTYTTIELFSNSLSAKTKLKGILEIVCGASEFDLLPMRPGEEDAVAKMIRHSPLSPAEGSKFTDPHTKAFALMQTHFSRRPVAGDLSLDQKHVLGTAQRLLQAIVDVISSSGWLGPALAAMDLSQMVVQGIWDKDSPLMQLPHVTKEVAERAKGMGVESVYDLLEMEDGPRGELLAALTDGQRADVARAANRYPSVEMSFQVLSGEEVAAGDPVQLAVVLERENEGEVGPVYAPRFPKHKDEQWWIVVGDPQKGALLAIKRITLAKKQTVKLQFNAPSGAGDRELQLLLVCDSYMGCDQEYAINLKITDEDADEEMEDA